MLTENPTIQELIKKFYSYECLLSVTSDLRANALQPEFVFGFLPAEQQPLHALREYVPRPSRMDSI
jgi:hypothetical protein